MTRETKERIKRNRLKRDIRYQRWKKLPWQLRTIDRLLRDWYSPIIEAL